MVACVGSGFRTGFFFCVKMLTGGRFRGAATDVPVGVTEFGPDGGLEGEELMLSTVFWRSCRAGGRRQMSRRLRAKVEAVLSSAVNVIVK